MELYCATALMCGAAIGLVDALITKRPWRSLGYSIGIVITSVALGILFKPAACYVALGLHVLAFLAEIGRITEQNAKIRQVAQRININRQQVAQLANMQPAG